MKRQKNGECIKAKRLQSDWTKEIKFNKNNCNYKDEIFEMILEFKDMLEGHLGRTLTVGQQISLTSVEVRLLHLGTSRAGL